MSDISQEPRVVRPIISAPKDPYWNFWRVLAVIVVGFILIPWLLAVSCLAAGTKAIEESTTKMVRENNRSVAQMQERIAAPRGADTAPAPQRYVESFVVPGKTIPECNQQTGGVINEQWRKCRNGYKTTREVWR